MNTVLQRYGGEAQGDMLVTCATIMQSFMLMVTMPLSGITSGTQTILGFNYGACRPERVRAAQKHIFILCAIFTSIMFTAAQLVPQLFVLIFTRDPAYIEMASRAIRIYTLGIIPLGIQYEIVDGFTGMGVVRLSLPLSFWRKLLYFVSLFVLPRSMGGQRQYSSPVLSLTLAGRCSQASSMSWRSGGSWISAPFDLLKSSWPPSDIPLPLSA